MAEREAELLALQAAFDEYIASSRELEEELDAELENMRTFFRIAVAAATAAVMTQQHLLCRGQAIGLFS